ncbi:MAG TPA: AraC family transcriptional regulator [Negativicutes bacterium]|jgi:AraC-like DNA-binding protein
MDEYTSNDEILRHQVELASLIDQRFTESDGAYSTAIPALSLMRATRVFELEHSIYEPSLCVVAQGAKIIMLSNERYQYDLSSYLVASVHLPVSGMVVEATPQKPHLCLKINFSAGEILDILKESDQTWIGRAESKRGLYVSRIDSSLLDAILRLVRLLDTPRDIPVLSPLFIREILYRVLQDEQGALVRQFAMIGSHAQSIAKVIRIINQDFSKPLRIDELAEEINMSASALHNQFKKVTAMSPIQYQKQIRLQKARQLLLSEAADAATAAFQVGYESPSQFSREYARMFGLPPLSDIKRLRSALLST